MSESPAPDEVQDQPDDQPAPEALEAPDTAPEAAEPEDFFSDTFDPASLPDELRPAYKQMRGAFTQKTQTLAEERREIEQHKQLIDFLSSDDPEEKALALQALGYDLDPGDPGYEDDLDEAEDTELASLKAEIADLREWRDGQQQSSEAAQYEDAMNEYLDEERGTLASKTGCELDEEEWEVLEDLAMTPKYHDDGLPSLEKAYERIYGDVLSKAKKGWLGKKKPQPAPGNGSAGTPQVDLSDDKARRAHMARIIEAGGD